MVTKEHILALFNELSNEQNKAKAASISNKILTCLTLINFYDLDTAKSKKEYEEMFHYYIETQGMFRINPNGHFADEVRKDVDRIL